MAHNINFACGKFPRSYLTGLRCNAQEDHDEHVNAHHYHLVVDCHVAICALFIKACAWVRSRYIFLYVNEWSVFLTYLYLSITTLRRSEFIRGTKLRTPSPRKRAWQTAREKKCSSRIPRSRHRRCCRSFGLHVPSFTRRSAGRTVARDPGPDWVVLSRRETILTLYWVFQCFLCVLSVSLVRMPGMAHSICLLGDMCTANSGVRPQLHNTSIPCSWSPWVCRYKSFSIKRYLETWES